MSHVAYVLVGDPSPGGLPASPSDAVPYTKDSLKATLQCLGCKPRHAYRISDAAFDAFAAIRDRALGPSRRRGRRAWRAQSQSGGWQQGEDSGCCVALSRRDFDAIVVEAMGRRMAWRGALSQDWRIACSLREHRRSVTVLLCGTSGTGKSTLASLLVSTLRVSHALLYFPASPKMLCVISFCIEKSLIQMLLQGGCPSPDFANLVHTHHW
eukprot:evm.model.scf_2047.1 EVM.evm.TU.scf_2047.1   scf_2047:656-3175(-)